MYFVGSLGTLHFYVKVSCANPLVKRPGHVKVSFCSTSMSKGWIPLTSHVARVVASLPVPLGRVSCAMDLGCAEQRSAY